MRDPFQNQGRARFGFSGGKVFKKSNNQSFGALETPNHIDTYALAQDANMAKCSCSGFCLSERLIICIFEHFSRFRGISGLAWLGGADGLPRISRAALPLADGIVTVVCPRLGNSGVPW